MTGPLPDGALPAAALREGRLLLAVQTPSPDYPVGLWQAEPHAFVSAEYWTQVARLAERGTLDALFLNDVPALQDPAHGSHDHLEPTVHWAHVAAATERLGLVVGASTTTNDPFELAERIATLDYLSGGRAGWHITAGSEAARNFGRDGSSPATADQRRARSSEFVDVVRALWVSAAGGPPVRHRGAFFDVEGRLAVPPSPQGRPVLWHDGTDSPDRILAGRTAEAVLVEPLPHDAAVARYRLIKRLAAQSGRNPDHVAVLTLVPVDFGDPDSPTPEQVADRLTDGFDAGALDGAVLAPRVLSVDLEGIVDRLVPLLRERSLFHHRYATGTLRGQLRDIAPTDPAAREELGTRRTAAVGGR